MDSVFSQELNSTGIQVVKKFESQLDIIRRKPARLQTISRSEEFKFGLHVVVYVLLRNEKFVDHHSCYLQKHRELFCKRLDEPVHKDMIAKIEENLRVCGSDVVNMKKILEKAQRLGLENRIENAKRARQLDMQIIECKLDTGVKSRTTDSLRSFVSVLGNFDTRNKLWRFWTKFENRLSKMIPGKNESVVGDSNLIYDLLTISSSLLPEHAATICRYFKFHCRYLDEEIRNLALYLEAFVHHDLVLGCQLQAANDLKLCNILLRKLDSARRFLIEHYSLRLYRVCMRTGSYQLADSWMRLRFVTPCDQKELTDTLHGTITSIRETKQLPTERIKLNGDNEGVGTQYRLPELKEEFDETSLDRPWWVEEFTFPTAPIPPSAGETCSSTAVTVLSHRNEPESPQTDPEDEVRFSKEASMSLVHNNKISDYDIYDYTITLPCLKLEDAIILDAGGKYRKTNIRKDVPYHCRVLSYDVLKDEWVITSDFCRVTGNLEVDIPGNSCEPLIGDCGLGFPANPYVFKVHRDPKNHTLRDYLAEIRAQCTASYYVDKFGSFTGDRFGRLVMLRIDGLLLFGDSNRERVIEIMTREKRIDINGKFKDSIKFDKFTNNESWKNVDVNTALLEAFAHYTYHASDGVLMVADLQGWVTHDDKNIIYTLTDPVIHCPSYPFRRFGRTNLEEKGITLFFTKIHSRCNDICQELNLKRPTVRPDGRLVSPFA